jgi:small-conductance mechanosensitive channel
MLYASQRWLAEQNSWWAAGIFLATLLLSATLYTLVARLLQRWAARTDSSVDNTMLAHLNGPLRLLVPVLSLVLVASLVNLPKAIIGPTHHAMVLAAIGLVAWLLIRVLRVVQDVLAARLDIASPEKLQERGVYTQVKVFRNIASFIVALLAVAFMLMTFDKVREFGVSLLASAGLAGVVIGFAAQRSIATAIAGIQVALAQPIRVNDVVIIENEWGRVEEITLTYVVVRIWDLRRLVVPINYFIEKPFQNWSRISPELLGTAFIYTDYRIPVDEVRSALGRILEGTELWNRKGWGLQVTNTSERALELRALMSANNSGDAWDLRCHVREKLVDFIQKTYPEYLPRLRADIHSTVADSDAGAKTAARVG